MTGDGVMCLICSRFFGSRYDNLANLNGSSEFAVMVTQLTALATIVTTVSSAWCGMLADG